MHKVDHKGPIRMGPEFQLLNTSELKSPHIISKFSPIREIAFLTEKYIFFHNSVAIMNNTNVPK